MSFSGISVGSLILIALIVVLLFGTKKLRHIGSDLGSAIHDFKEGMRQNDQNEKKPTASQDEHSDALSQPVDTTEKRS